MDCGIDYAGVAFGANRGVAPACQLDLHSIEAILNRTADLNAERAFVSSAWVGWAGEGTQESLTYHLAAAPINEWQYVIG